MAEETSAQKARRFAKWMRLLPECQGFSANPKYAAPDPKQVEVIAQHLEKMAKELEYASPPKPVVKDTWP